MYSIVSETVNAVCLLTYSGCNVLTTGQSHRRQAFAATLPRVRSQTEARLSVVRPGSG